MATTSKKSSTSSKPSSSAMSANKTNHSKEGRSTIMHHDNSKQNMISTGQTILAVAAGAVAGAGLALLLAPQSGSETRRSIKRSAQNLKDDLNNTLQQGMDKINNIVGGNKDSEKDSEMQNPFSDTGRVQTTIISGTISTPGPSGTEFESDMNGI